MNRRVSKPDRRKNRKTSLAGLAVSVGVAAVLLGMGALISLLAPVHVLTLRRQGQHVGADVDRLLLLVIPVSERSITGITAVSTRTYAPPLDPQPAANPADVVRPELQGFLMLQSERSTIDIPASPSDLEAIERSVRDFLADHEPVLRLRIVSNW